MEINFLVQNKMENEKEIIIEYANKLENDQGVQELISEIEKC